MQLRKFVLFVSLEKLFFLIFKKFIFYQKIGNIFFIPNAPINILDKEKVIIVVSQILLDVK